MMFWTYSQLCIQSSLLASLGTICCAGDRIQDGHIIQGKHPIYYALFNHLDSKKSASISSPSLPFFQNMCSTVPIWYSPADPSKSYSPHFHFLDDLLWIGPTISVSSSTVYDMLLLSSDLICIMGVIKDQSCRVGGSQMKLCLQRTYSRMPSTSPRKRTRLVFPISRHSTHNKNCFYIIIGFACTPWLWSASIEI